MPVLPERPPAPVRVAPAVARDVPVYLEEIGRVAATETVAVRPQVTGRVTAVRFAEGSDVRRGDVLAEIDARPFQARLDSAEAALLRARAALRRAQTAVLRPQATLDRAKATLDLARTEFARVAQLLASNAVARADFDARRSAVTVAEAEVRQAEADLASAEPETAQAEAEVRQAEADVASARLDVEYCTVRAPIDGRAGRRLVDAGNVVSAHETSVVVLQRLDEVHVDFSVAEGREREVQRHARAGTLRAEVTLPGEDAPPHVGALTFVDSSVESATGTLRLRATLENEDRALWPGRFVRVRLVLATQPAAVLVPAGSEQLSAQGTFVYVVEDGGTAAMRPVRLGQRHGDLVVVSEGVRAGERVVVEGQFAVTPGGRVRVVPEAETARAGPAPEGGAR